MQKPCRSDKCDAMVEFFPTVNGKGMPLDVVTDRDQASVVLVPIPGCGRVAIQLTGETLSRAQDAGVELHSSHFATCPDAERFKGAGQKGRS